MRDGIETVAVGHWGGQGDHSSAGGKPQEFKMPSSHRQSNRMNDHIYLIY